MWSRLCLVFLVGVAIAEPSYKAWKPDTEYEYNIRGRTLAALHDVGDQYTGIILRARLTIKPKTEDILEAKLWRAQYAQIHTNLPDGWKSKIPDSMLDLKQFPISEKVFEIKMRHGVVRELIVDKDVPTWEVNVLKSIVSQLQVDTQGENLMASRYNQEPEEDRPNAMYKTMEDSVSGKCEVLYDISKLPQYVHQSRPDLVPMPELRGEGDVIDIVKTKNYSNCEQRMSYHFGIPGSNEWNPSSNNGESMSRSSVSRIVITGDLKTFTIQSSVTTNKVVMSPTLPDDEKGMVSSRVNVTLVRMGPVSSDPWSTPANPESTGNLVYSFNDPSAGPDGVRRASGLPLDSRNSEERRDRYAKALRREYDDDDSSASKSSSVNANSLESDENQLYWLPKPTLKEAPATPLLPFFIGYGGKSINQANDFDCVSVSKTLASQIGSELQNPNAITDEQTLEKFTILARLIRTMSAEQIAEAQKEIYQSDNEIDPHNEGQSVRRYTWAAFRDAVAQAGTGPALYTIGGWIKERKIKGAEAASVVGALSKTARTPTPDYMDVFFELATMPETTNEEILNSTAIITFAELIRYSQVNHDSANKRYAVHVYGRLSPKHNPAIFRDYIPYMAAQLKQSIEKNELAKSHVFIRALGNVAHPKILAVFEPYLEGKIPATIFQRTMMVMSLNKLASLRPRLARGVLYRIYQNTAEAHQVRCAAVFFLMSTHPPESMLQRMAEFTNYDHSKHVNAAVKSSIESASELKTKDTQDFATIARNVRSLLNKESYDFGYSKNLYFDNAIDEVHQAYQVHTAFISSDDSFIPQAFYASMKTIYGDFKAPKPELAAMVSSVKDLYNEVRKQFNQHNREKSENTEGIQFSAENIAKLLKIEGQENEKLEGAFWMKSKYNNKFMSFDKDSLQRIPDFLRKVYDAIKEGRNYDMAKLESYDLTLSFPMESGFPFLYTLKVPTLLKVSGSLKGDHAGDAMKVSVGLRLLCSMQLQARLGFVAPFEHQHYMAGVTKNYQAYVPIRADIGFSKSDTAVTLELQPIDQNEKYKILHYSVMPFTSRHNILDTSPVMKDKETHQLKNLDAANTTVEFGSKTRGVRIRIDADSPPGGIDTPWGMDLLGNVIFPLSEAKIRASKTEIFLIPYPSSEQSILLTTSFETLHDDTTKYDEDRTRSAPKGKAPKVTSKKMYDPERRNEFIKEAAKGIAAADAFAVELGVKLPGQDPVEMVMTVAFANSEVDEKSRALAYWRINDISSNTEFESCAGLEGRSPKDVVPLDDSSTQFRAFDVDLRVGKSCEKGTKLEFQGKQMQTEQYREIVKKLPFTMQCVKELKSRSKSMPSCKAAEVMSSFMDTSVLKIIFDPTTDDSSRYIPDIIATLDGYLPSLSRTAPTADVDKNTLQLSMSFDDPSGPVKYEVETADLRLIGGGLDVGPFAILATNYHPHLSMSDLVEMTLVEGDLDSKPECVIDSDWATTFDEATYPIHLGKCWHVAMTTYPKKAEDDRVTEPIDEDMKTSVVVRDTQDDGRDVKFVLGKYELKMTSYNSKIRVELNNNPLDLSEKRGYRQKNAHGDLDFELLQRANGYVRLLSSKYDIDALYDGKRVWIQASSKYRNDVRGLCGNYDGEPVNDFTSPKNCILSKPELFVASYAMTKDECQGPALDNAKKAQEAECVRKTAKPANVISDREAGRVKKGKPTWGYHNDKNSDNEKNQDSHHKWHCMEKRTKTIEEADQICFSLRPAPSCSSGCKPVQTKFKVLPFHCMPKGESARQLADRIKQGANPDFSQKKPSKTTNFDMPVRCEAA